MKRHTTKDYDLELDKLRMSVIQLGSKVLDQLASTQKALMNKDSGLALQVIRGDTKINEMTREIDEFTVTLMALRQPMAVDLRTIVAAQKISNEYERIADYASNIAQEIIVISKVSHLPIAESLYAMAGKTQKMLKDILEAYEKEDVQLADQVFHKDDEVDELYVNVLNKISEQMTESESDSEPWTHILLMARSLERIGDHITNVAEQIHFLVKGVIPGGKDDKSVEKPKQN